MPRAARRSRIVQKAGHSSHRLRILVAEDSPTQAERVRMLLEEAGYEIELAGNGREGLERVRLAPPDLVVSDVLMPEMDGYEFCRAVKSSPGTKPIPFVLLTGQRTPGDIIKGLECGCDNFITKPFEDEYLLERIRRIFEHLEHRKRGHFEMEVVLRAASREIVINTDKQQIIELLFATSEELADANNRLEESRRTVEEYARNLEDKVEERTRQVAEAEAKYRALVEEVPAVTYRASLEGSGRLLYVSPQSEAILGLKARDLVRDPGALRGRIHPEDRERVEAVWKDARENGRPYSIEYRLGAREKHEMWVRDQAVVHGESAGGPRYLQGILLDVTERKRLEEQLRQSQRIEAVGRLAGGVAHDFNNLLSVITGYSELALQDKGLEPRLRDRVQEVLKAAERAARLTRQLLAFSRKQLLEPRILDLNAVVTDMDKMLRRIIGEDIALETHLVQDLGAVRADPGQIEQVIMNLAVNARDAMPRGGKLTIETSNIELDEEFARRHVPTPPGRYAMLAMSDIGCGMDEETRSHMFEPFYTTKEQGKGTGLGLATVYGIVKQSGGYIWVYSEPGHGATFKIYLPIVQEAVEPARPVASSAEAERGSETVLLVEDEEMVRAMLRACLEGAGYAVLEAPAPEAALRLSAEHRGRIHLLVTDVVMPGMSGREVARTLSPSRPDMKVLYLSGYTDEAIVRHGMLEPGLAFLQKPFSPAALRRKVRELIDSLPAGRN